MFTHLTLLSRPAVSLIHTLMLDAGYFIRRGASASCFSRLGWPTLALISTLSDILLVFSLTLYLLPQRPLGDE
jgi:hypothetical protein